MDELKPCPFCGCDDLYIDYTSEDVPRIFCNHCKVFVEPEDDAPYASDDECIKYLMDKVTRVWNSRQPQRKPGRWIESNLVPSRKGKPDGRLFICSECNKGWVKQDRSMEGINFCPNCGAEMDGGEQDDSNRR